MRATTGGTVCQQRSPYAASITPLNAVFTVVNSCAGFTENQTDYADRRDRRPFILGHCILIS